MAGAGSKEKRSKNVSRKKVREECERAEAEEKLKAEYGEALGAASSLRQTRQGRKQKVKLVYTNVTTTYPSLTQYTGKGPGDNTLPYGDADLVEN